MNFLRCNKCYEPLKSSNPPFSLTQCGHIFCHKCLSSDKQCFECKTQVESLPLTQPLPDGVASLFIPAPELLDQFLFTYKFQHAEMMITMRRFEEIEKKYNGMKTAYWKLRKHYDDLTKAYKRLQESPLQCQPTQKVTPIQHTQGYVNFPRSYFANDCQSNNNQIRNNINRSSQLMRGPMINNGRSARFNMNNCQEGYQTDDSMNSIPGNHVRNGIETPPITPDVGIFRIPNVRNLPQSVGTSSGTSRNSNDSVNTPINRNKMF
ncbi:hypothetical protein PV325_008942 [Microctonus aethiopoides]|uniref:RING-type domain-containing protein n=1 Tax=Microctonus aethiopoides TaxID=144406 RepID=A0AA39FQV2_9HYME|nr:hypothetical protein PV325_008942 [Microctonus aethiopoides]KAK0174018.1 hypothetical protein PV328_007138 [Microctonus aethiopoides]